MTDDNTARARTAVPALSLKTSFRSALYQTVLALVLVGAVWFLISNLTHNRDARGIATGYGFLSREAGFSISETLISFAPSDSYARAFLIGLLNTLRVSLLAIVLSTILGVSVGIARLSPNWLVRKLAAGYVDLVRNVPLIAQLLLWIGLIRVSAPSPRQAINFMNTIFISNRGIQIPSVDMHGSTAWIILAVLASSLLIGLLVFVSKRGRQTRGAELQNYRTRLALLFSVPVLIWITGHSPVTLHFPELKGFNYEGGWSLSPEFVAMLMGLTVYSGAFIAEIVRGGLMGVSQGQSEAAYSLGLHRGATLQRIVLPQAVRLMIPPLTSQYLNVFKNSSLAAAIGYPDLVSIGNTTGNQTGQVIEAVSIFMAVYLAISISIAVAMNAYNDRMALKAY